MDGIILHMLIDNHAQETPHPFCTTHIQLGHPNLYTQYKIFKQKVDFAFKGLYKDNDAASKVCAILNWLDDNAYEIYEHLHWAAGDDNDDPEKVLEAFENYFKPEHANNFLPVFAVSGPFTGFLVLHTISWFSRSEVCAFVLGNICERFARRDLC